MVNYSSIMEVIKLVLSFIGGLASYGLIQFFINRNDAKKKERYLRLNAILERVSEYSKGLNKSFNIWHENFHVIIELLESYISGAEEYRENVNFLKSEYKDVIKEEGKHICKFAQLCPRRLSSSESPLEVREYCDKASVLSAKFDSLEGNIRDKLIEIIHKIESPLSGFEDILNSFPEVYSLPYKAHKRIFAQLSKIQILNSNLLLRMTELKSDPISNITMNKITKKNDLLGDMLIDIIEEVEYTKKMIARFIH